MSCRDQGTAAPEPFDLGDAGSGSSIGFMQVRPDEFSRAELQALLKKVRDLLNFAMLSDVKREYLECMEEDLDVLDALATREEADLAELEETIAEHSAPTGVTVSVLACPYGCVHHPCIINIPGVPHVF